MDTVKSMTGYARVHYSFAFCEGIVDLHTVNKKGLDLHIQMPKELLSLDVDVRRWLSQELQRGQVTFKLTLSWGKSFPENFVQTFKLHQERWLELCKIVGCDVGQVSLGFLMEQFPLKLSLSSEEEGVFKRELQQATQKALEILLQMKCDEGALLLVDLQQRLFVIEAHLERLEGFKERVIDSYKEKINQKLEEIGLIDDELKARTAKEVAILAEKTDITEELVRLKAHLNQTHKLLLSPSKSIGRVLDFLVQEMHREANTIGSKSQDRDIAQIVIDMKSEIDRVKEQIQNIE